MVSANDLQHQTRRAARRAAPWLQGLARLGYAAKGVIYCVIGLLALRAAYGDGEKTTDAGGALEVILKQPFGRFLLGIVVIGLIGYALRRFVQAIWDPEREGTDFKGIVSRLGFMISGLAYSFLAWTAVELIEGVKGKRYATQRWTAHLLHIPDGQLIVTVMGALILAAGIYGIHFAVAAKFRKHLAFDQLGSTQTKWLTHLGRFGYAARGIVFIVIGMYLMQAGIHADPNAAKGMDGAQNVLEHWSDGALRLVAVGLIAFGGFMFVEARYNRMTVK